MSRLFFEKLKKLKDNVELESIMNIMDKAIDEKLVDNFLRNPNAKYRFKFPKCHYCMHVGEPDYRLRINCVNCVNNKGGQ